MTLSTLSILDYLIIAYLLYHIIKGFKKGFITILVETLTMIIAIIIIISYYKQTAQFIQTLQPMPETYSTILSLILIVLIMLTGSWLINKFISLIINVSGLGLMNQIAGSFIGGIKGLCILIPLIVPLLWIKPTLIQNSTLLFKARQLIKFDIPEKKLIPATNQSPIKKISK
jgi:uncharacterized membrane protein required for colicin V production